MTKPKRIKITSKKAPLIQHTGPREPLVDPRTVSLAQRRRVKRLNQGVAGVATLPNIHGLPIKARRFYLYRFEDVSGVSGKGKVAEGVEFENGMCALSFSSSYQHVNTYANIRAVMYIEREDFEVHGHGGKTKVVYVDGNGTV